MKLLEVYDLKKHFPVRTSFFRKTKQFVHAVDGVSLTIAEGETLGLVGESGCGKTTLGKIVMRFIDPDEGSIRLMGRDVLGLDGAKLRALRANMQMIFQDPLASLNPRKPIREILSEPYIMQGVTHSKREAEEQALLLLEQVGIVPPEVFIDRYPHEISGGQRQRIVIARAIALKPNLIVADEPVSAMDLSVRAQILELMKSLKNQYNLAYLFITHDLSVVRSLANRVAVMYFGRIVELGSVEDVFRNPLHPYTMALLSASPIPNPRKARKRRRIILSGEVPDATVVPSGCRFHPRCPFGKDVCITTEPLLSRLDGDHLVACHFSREVSMSFRPHSPS